MSKDPLIALSLIPSKNEFHLTEDMILEVVLKNISGNDVSLPEFPEDKTATTYLFDLQFYKELNSFKKNKINSVRPPMPAVKAALAISKIILKAKEEKKYKIALNWWLIERDKAPFRAPLEPGTYEVKILWKPPTQSWLQEMGYSVIDAAREGDAKIIKILP